MILGIAAVLGAGAAFLPIDHRLPDSRIAFMLKDSGSAIAPCQRSLVELLPRGISGVVLDDHSSYEIECDLRGISHYSQDLAYVIYTSGATGTPKGVPIEHSSLVNLVTWHNRIFSVTDEDRTAKYAGFSFDASIYQTFFYLASGGGVAVVPSEIKLV